MSNPPTRWHIYIADLSPRVGSKPGKQRPCVVIQPTAFGEAGLESTVIIPLTTRISGEGSFPLRVRIPKGICGLTTDSDALIDQILSWDNGLFKKDMGLLPEEFQDAIKAAVLEFLDLI